MLFALLAWRMAIKEREKEPRIEVLSAVGGGLITGLAVGLAVLFLQKSFEESQKYATWRASVEVAESIPGFAPNGRDIRGINFSGKRLHAADFTEADLEDSKLRDADLDGAVFNNANLRGADLIGANLREASLDGADLEGALLQDTNFAYAIVSPKIEKAQVNARTCWPPTMRSEMLEKVIVMPAYDKNGVKIDDMKDGLKGGQRFPCPLRKE
ncbi:pentapeptide repeat-containing protein [Streptomyces asoensis]|uniref:Pentapeptide repeat-containing protein n=2 Tax=Streptomyces asoensis TaxID=249586 RepID=A0A6M4X3F5_9ACTN|nr:pentapeptide repeat-containing protein [Streptomyces asoensis]